MNALENKLQSDLMTAMKEHNENRIRAIRSVKTAITEALTAPGAKKELDDNDIVKIIQKQIKQREESISIYEQAGRNDAAEAEESEMMWLNLYVPKMFDENQTRTVVDKVIEEIGATTMKDMGRVMKELNARYPNQIDGKLASSMIKSKLA